MRRPIDESAIVGLNRLPGPVRMLVAGAGYFAATFVNSALAFSPEEIPVLSVAAGVAAYFLVVTERPKAWIWVAVGVYAGQVAGDLVHDRGLSVALGLGLTTLPFAALA